MLMLFRTKGKQDETMENITRQFVTKSHRPVLSKMIGRVFGQWLFESYSWTALGDGKGLIVYTVEKIESEKISLYDKITWMQMFYLLWLWLRSKIVIPKEVEKG